jgi:hypothetical protein
VFGVGLAQFANDGVEQYALNEASFVLVKLLQRYNKIEALDHEPIVKQLSMTLAPENGAKVRMHRADA